MDPFVVAYCANPCCLEPRDSCVALTLGKLQSVREAKALTPQEKENRSRIWGAMGAPGEA